LDQIDFIWEPHDEAWEQGFAALKKFQAREGHGSVPQTHDENGIKLGQWVRRQRATKRALSSDKIERLIQLGFSWNPFADLWDEGFAALQKFYKLKGHCRVPLSYTGKGVQLGSWVAHQRANKTKLKLNQFNQLKSLDFSWNPRLEQWEEGLAALKVFFKREGHCNVHPKHRENSLRLGGWVVHQRQKRESLTANQVKLLDRLGFCWNPIAELWEKGFLALQKFHKDEGHCRVPQRHKEKSVRLGAWVSKQRGKKSKLTREQIKRLNALGFVWKT
jgi:hypothetical protein